MILISVETIRWISHTSRIIPENPPFFLPGIKTLFQQATGRMTSDQLQELFLRSWTIERDAGSQKAHKSNRKQRESQQKRFSLRAAMHHVKYPAAEMHFLTARYFSQSFLKKDAPLASKQAISSLPAMSAFLTHPPTSLRACPSYSMSERVSFDLPPPPDTTRVNGRLPHLVSLFHPEGVEVEEVMIWGHYHYHLYSDQCNHLAHHHGSQQYCCNFNVKIFRLLFKVQRISSIYSRDVSDVQLGSYTLLKPSIIIARPPKQLTPTTSLGCTQQSQKAGAMAWWCGTKSSNSSKVYINLKRFHL